MSARANKSPDWHPELDIDKIHMLDACRDGRLDKVYEFLNGTSNQSPAVDVDEGDDDGTTALQIAAARGNLNLVIILIRNYDAKVDLANELGFTPFLHACREGHLEVAMCLKESGANETLKTKFGVSALGLAAAGGHSKIINFLMSLNLDINSKETNLTPTPLMAASARSQVEAAICLESRGAKVDYASPVFGLTALHAAILSGSVDILDTLIELGGRLDQVQLCNRNAKAIAEHAGNREAVLYMERLGRQQMQGGQRPRLQRTQITSIIERCDLNELEQLKLRDPREYQSNGITPLMYAVLLDRPKAIEFLCHSNEDFPNFDPEINAQEPEMGLSALMMAIIVGDLDMTERFLDAGADPHLYFQMRKDSDPFTAFDLALFSGFSDALRLLFLFGYADTSKHVGPKQHKSAPKIIINRFLHRFGLGETETPTEPQRTRDQFNLLLQAAHLDFTQAIPFRTAQELLMTSEKKPSPAWHTPTADDRLQLVRNLAKTIIEKEGFLKPFPVGTPQNGDFTRVENLLLSANSRFMSPIKQNDYLGCPQPGLEQGYEEIRQMNAMRSRTNSNASRNYLVSSNYSNDPTIIMSQPSVNVNNVDYEYLLRPFTAQQRSVPSRRLSENASTQSRLSMYAQNDKHWSSSEASAGQYTRAASMAMESREPPNYGSRTQSPLLQPSRTPNPRPNRPFSLYSPSTSSVPNSPAIPALIGQRRFTTANRMQTPTQSPKIASGQALRKRVPPAGIVISRFDSQSSSTSAPSTPPNNSLLIPQIQLTKSLPNTQRLPAVLTMAEIEQRLKRLQLNSYYSIFVQQEIDPTVFLQLSLADFQKLVQNERVAEKIWTLSKQLKEEFGGTIEESL